MSPIRFTPPLLNSASVWATTEEDLFNLYNCASTGAVTTRTSLLKGFDHNPDIHQYIYFDVRTSTVKHVRSPNANCTLNTLGYSYIPLQEYLTIIERIVSQSARPRKASKPFIVSVTGTSADIVECHNLISQCASRLPIPLYMEINLSCPNIPNKPPPAFSAVALQEYLFALQSAFLDTTDKAAVQVTVGIKTPPYTYHDQFASLIESLLATTGDGLHCPIDFITATNTLGNCLVLAEAEDVMAPKSDMTAYAPALPSESGIGIGGVGGALLHPLALGNVRTIRRLLDQHDELRQIDIIGVGGVSDYAGYARMKTCGAAVVGIGTALGKEGLEVFEKMTNEIDILESFGKLAFGHGVKNSNHMAVLPNGHVDAEVEAEALKRLNIAE